MVSTHGSDTPPIFQRSRIPIAQRDWIIKSLKSHSSVVKSFSRTFTWARRRFCRTGARCRGSCTKTRVRLSLLSICGCVFVSKAVNENCVGYWMRGGLLVYKGQWLYRVKGGEIKNASERGSEAEKRPERLKCCAPWRSSAATRLCRWLGSIVPV